ncbi:MAG: hypothetical protein COV47_02340 [Candidatus Diapherotrites archaeon CG11_big_fil_rev_8_21_14_0_20_37_9]|nr:MAG: hypothetical protein COV47_02340 [Candidatus Diapherotrites archaeon CG11_big_fil_rev_8_21_14_0_20_37_9]
MHRIDPLRTKAITKLNGRVLKRGERVSVPETRNGVEGTHVFEYSSSASNNLRSLGFFPKK